MAGMRFGSHSLYFVSIICVIWPWEKDGITASFPKAWRALIMSSFYSQLFYYIRMSSCEAMILK